METLRRYIVGPTPQEQVRTWQQSIRKDSRQMDRQINSIVQAESKTKTQIKALAKRGDAGSCRLLAKEILKARKSRNRMEASKATLESLSMQLNEQLATIKITGTLQKSTKIMREVNTLVKLPDLTATMGRLQLEMTKAGVMDEMVSDTLDMDLFDEEEEEADEEVSKILGELTGEQFRDVAQVPSGLPGATTQPEEEADDEEEEMQLAAMRDRLAALKE